MHLDRGFWTATAVIVVLSIAAILFWIFVPITGIMPEAVDRAAQIDLLYRFLAASGSGLLVAVFGYIFYFVFRFRRRRDTPDDAIGLQIHDNHKLEFWWTLLPALYVLVLAIISVDLFFQIEPVNAQGNTLVVEAIGYQWHYTFRYPGIHGEVKDLHLPIGQPVTMHVSAMDVIHSFWIPDMRLKVDMVPGLINTLVFTPTRAGKYELLCTEFCGTGHGEMRSGTSYDHAWVYLEPKAQYDAWYSRTQKAQANVSDAIQVASSGSIDVKKGDAAAGKALFQTKCSECHAIAPFDKTIVGPGLLGVLHDPSHPNLVNGDKATPENVAKILQNGYKGTIGSMPNQTANGLTDKDIANLVAYLNTLK